MPMRRHAPNGLSLVEAIMAIAVFAIGGAAVLELTLGALGLTLGGADQLRAPAYATEAMEAAASIRNTAWNALVPGTHGVTDASGTWAFSGTGDTEGKFSRTVLVEEAERDASKDLLPGGTNDIHTRKVTVTVTWPVDVASRSGTLTQTRYFTNWDSADWFEDTSADWGDGSFSSTSVSTAVDADGAVALQQNAALWACAETEGAVDIPGSQPGQDVVADGNYAYVVTSRNSSHGEFVVVDKTDPANPTEVASIELNADANAVALVGQYAYVATSDNSAELRVVNVTTPASPSLVGSLNLSGNEDALDVAASGSRAYVTRANNASGAELFVVSITSPSSPVLLGSTDLGGSGRGVALSGTHVYAAMDNTSGEFKAVDVSVDASPTVVGTLNLPPATGGQELALGGGYAYVVTDNNSSDDEFFVVDISVPTAPFVEGSVDLGNGALVVVMDGTTAFVGTATANQRTLQIVDASDPSAPTVAVNQKISKFAYNGLYWDGTRLYVASQDNDAELLILRTLSSATWACPEQKAEIDLAGNTTARAVYVSGTTMYLGTAKNAGGPEFLAYDVTDPTAPSLVGSLEVGEDVNDLAVSGSYAYLATSANAAELRVVSLAVPSSPVSVGTYNAAGNTDGQAVNVYGNTVLLAQGSTLYSLNVTVPALPTLRGSVALGGTGYRIEMYTSAYAYVATANNSAEVRVIDYSSATPTIAGSINIAGTSDARGLWIKGTTLYVALNSGTGIGAYAYDISAPTSPSYLDSLSLGQSSYAITADNDEDYAFAGTNKNGQELKVIDTTTTTAIELSGVLNLLNGFVYDLYFANDVIYVANAYNGGEAVIVGKLTGGGGGGGGTTYATSGTYESSAFDAGADANWNTIEWSADVASCPSGTVRLQERSAPTALGLSSEEWSGPDGIDGDESDFHADAAGELVHLDLNGDRYFQYRATLGSDGSCTPYLTDITVNYTPL